MGLRGIENSLTTFTDVFVPTENLIAGEGAGPAHRAVDAEHRPPVAAGDLRGDEQVRAEDLARVRRQPQAVGRAGRQARPGRPDARLRGRLGVRHRGAGRRVQPPGRRQAQRHPHRGRPGQAVRLRAGLAGHRHDDPDPRRPRLRDGRVAAGARREAGPRRAAAARHAHQPHLRGLHRDHAPADRARGRRPAPVGRRRHPRPQDGDRRQGQGRAEGRRLLRHLVPQARRRRGPEAGQLRASSARWPSTPATSRSARASWPARPST